jgi:hypothetical protein
MHNTGDRAMIVWRLRARHTVATCILEPLAVGALLVLRQDDEVVFQDMFPAAHLAEARAEALRKRLEAKGWRAVPMEDAEGRRRRA